MGKVPSFVTLLGLKKQTPEMADKMLHGLYDHCKKSERTENPTGFLLLSRCYDTRIWCNNPRLNFTFSIVSFFSIVLDSINGFALHLLVILLLLNSFVLDLHIASLIW